MNNIVLPKSGNGLLNSGESGTNKPRLIFTMDISGIKDLPTLYKLIDKLKDGQGRFINYSMPGDADG